MSPLIVFMGVSILAPILISMIWVIKKKEPGYLYLGVAGAWLVDICWWFLPAAHHW